MSLRSAHWFDRSDLDGFLHRAWLKSEGYTDESFRGKPIIGISNPWSELVNCNVHLRGLAESVKRGVLQAGGFPLEFSVLALGEALMKPTTMLYRNLMAMDVEESIRAYPLDGVVLLASCDKTTPASIMGALSADVPAIVVTGGPMLNGHWRGEDIGSCTDCWRYWQELRAGRLTRSEFDEIEQSITRSNGHCMTMGTASTMACLTEALGLTLPGGAAIPAVDSMRAALAEAAGRQIVSMVRDDLKPSDIVTPASLRNAIRVLHAISGSTNAILHLTAFAGRLGIDLPLDDFDAAIAQTPWLADLKPAGQYLMEDFHHAGGTRVLMAEMADLLDLDALTVSGERLGEVLAKAGPPRGPAIRPRSQPLGEDGSLVVLRGSLCPGGAVLKASATNGHLLQHEGRAVVFENAVDMAARINDPELDIDERSVLVLKNAGPIGAPGMPEWGKLPIPDKLLKRGVTDLVRISDARMSGTSYGTVVLHVTPESAVGGPLALVQDGDVIRLDVAGRALDLLVDTAELETRRRALPPPNPPAARGYRRLYAEHVLQADQGCDFDFLLGASPVTLDELPVPRQ